ncbi:Serine/threonine-protein kinase Pkn1 [Rubripirellula tenax]|uniref:Serine/threonine-protein kinase Pkn1 n=2 Tax=Rubripirellula tenax TaxID=2528015 RepID=A0A5C6FFT0_9BACT|nr:Serine/threonine-protein kinase Pkn1 [Rubripirellula tenax]
MPNDDVNPCQLSSIDELSRIFSQVVDMPRDRQETLLDELCPDHQVRQQLRAMLQADSSEDPLLDHSLVPKPVEVCVGEKIDGYELLQELARGGMGVVFLAEQIEPVRRKVALKVIKPGVDTREVIARFDAERHALSLMDHPNIAKVLDAGTTDAGRPYFVMELVKGQPITTYCDHKQMSAKERLELFLSVCRAIQHAHQKGIIHRDIKPSNVLVAEYDGRPVAKVIDFGVAKAINQSLTDMTMQTGFGQIIGTFEYMSPEQSRVNQLDVDTRSDIYSLGVLLYELLTGCPPFDKKRLRSVTWDEMLRIIREEDPPKPSVRLSEITETDANGKRDPGSPASLGNLVRNELDWIVMKAMEKDRTRRYETPSSLANDIERFLRGDAVAACPPSAAYLFRKFARRNKVVLATSAIVAASLVLGLIGTTWQAVRAGRAERVAEASRDAVAASRDEAETIIAFLKEHLLSLAGTESQVSVGTGLDPNVRDPNNRSVTLDRVRTQVDQRFADQPELQAKLKDTLASSFNSIGRYDVEASLYKDVLKYLDSDESRTREDRIRVMRQLGRAYLNQSQLAAAEPLFAEALDCSRQQLGNEHELTLLIRNDTAILRQQQGRYQEAEAEYQECLSLSRQLRGDDHPDTLDSQSNLAILYVVQGRLDEAEELHKRVLDVQQKNRPPNSARIAASSSNLGRCYLQRGRRDGGRGSFEAAASHLEKGLALYREARPLDHPETLEAQWTLAQVYCEQDRFEDAVPLLEDLVERLKRLRGSEYSTTLDAMNALGWACMHQGRFVDAENVLAEAVTTRRRLSLRDSPTVRVMGNLAIVYQRMGKLEKSIEQDTETFELAMDVVGPSHPETLSCLVRLGLSFLDGGRIDEGQVQLEKALDASKSLPGAFKIAGVLATSWKDAGDSVKARSWTDRQAQIARNNSVAGGSKLSVVLAECGTRLLAMRFFNDAEQYLRESIGDREADAPKDWTTYDTQSKLGEALFGQQRYGEAEPLLLEAFEGLKQHSEGTGDGRKADLGPALLRAINRLIAFYEAIENADEATRWRQKMADHTVSSKAVAGLH